MSRGTVILAAAAHTIQAFGRARQVLNYVSSSPNEADLVHLWSNQPDSRAATRG